MSDESKRARGRGCWGCVGRTLLVCVVVFVVVDVAATIITGRQVDAAIAKLRAEGAPVTFADAAPPPVLADQNAGPLYVQITDLIAPHAYKGDSPSYSAGSFQRPSNQPLGYSGADWTNPEDIKGLAALLKQDARALELLDRAADMPGCRHLLESHGGIGGLVRLIGPKLVHLHLHDVLGEVDHLEIGTGEVAFDQIVDGLADIGCVHTATLEMNPDRVSASGIRRSLRTFRGILSAGGTAR